MKKLFIFVFMLLTVSAFAQDRPKFLYTEFADKSVTLYPFYKPFGNNFDPAITLGGGLEYRQKGNLTLFQTAQINGYTTRLAGNGITLTSSIGYRYGLTPGIFGEAAIGLGASLFYPSREAFSQDENGKYASTIPINIVGALPVDLLLGYGGDQIAFYLKYRYMLAVPYTESMPALPMSLIGAGIRFNIQSANN